MIETAITQDVRERIIRRFEAWLDESLASGRAPDGIAAEILAEAGAEEAPPFDDFYSMWAAVTALTQEVRLQGRAFKQMGSSLEAAAGLRDTVEELRSIVTVSRQERQERERGLERDSARRALKDVLESLLAIRDSLARGLESSRAFQSTHPAPGALARWFAMPDIERARAAAGDSVSALEKGYLLAMDKLDDALRQMEVHPIHCEGEFFDPASMNAVDLEETAAVPEGTVTAVYRTGYRWRGDVYRPAQVKVAKAPAGAEKGTGQG